SPAPSRWLGCSAPGRLGGPTAWRKTLCRSRGDLRPLLHRKPCPPSDPRHSARGLTTVLPQGVHPSAFPQEFLSNWVSICSTNRSRPSLPPVLRADRRANASPCSSDTFLTERRCIAEPGWSRKLAWRKPAGHVANIARPPCRVCQREVGLPTQSA